MWQPIETAPRDGQEILAFAPDYDDPLRVSWDSELGGWSDCFSCERLFTDPIVKWAPLPAAPPPDCVDCNGMPCWETQSGELFLVFSAERWAEFSEESRQKLHDAAIEGEWPKS